MPMRKHFVGPWKKWRLSNNGLSLGPCGRSSPKGFIGIYEGVTDRFSLFLRDTSCDYRRENRVPERKTCRKQPARGGLKRYEWWVKYRPHCLFTLFPLFGPLSAPCCGDELGLVGTTDRSARPLFTCPSGSFSGFPTPFTLIC